MRLLLLIIPLITTFITVHAESIAENDSLQYKIIRFSCSSFKYDVGIFAAARGRAYDTHGQLGWGTPIAAHWAWNGDDLAAGPLGFARENHAPFYVGHNGKAELARGDYNVVVFTDVNGNARGAIKILNDANALLDTWFGHFDLGRAYLAAGDAPPLVPARR